MGQGRQWGFNPQLPTPQVPRARDIHAILLSPDTSPGPLNVTPAPGPQHSIRALQNTYGTQLYSICTFTQK